MFNKAHAKYIFIRITFNLETMLYELIYRSKAADNITENDLREILEIARTFNGQNNITGCLLYSNKQFLQLLEGEFDVLMTLYEKIKVDDRHHDVHLLHMRESQYRIYPDWTMAFKSLRTSELNSKAGVSEFTELEEAHEDSMLSQQLFKSLGDNLG